MCGHDDGAAGIDVRAKTGNHDSRIVFVKIPGRLVGQKHGRVAEQRSTQRNPLGLTARYLAWPSGRWQVDTELREERDRSIFSFTSPPATIHVTFEDVVEHAARGVQHGVLEDEPDRGRPNQRAGGVADSPRVSSVEAHGSRYWSVEEPDDEQES